MDDVYRFLRKTFSDKRLADEFMAKSEFLDIKAHTTILKENAYVTVIPFVYDGRVKVMRNNEEGKEILLYYINPGESCALSTVAGLTHTKSVAYAETEVDTKLFAVPVSAAEDMHANYQQCRDFCLHLFRDRFNELILFIDSIAFKTMDFRLIQYLKQKQKKTGTNSIYITHQQMADELGTAREVVSRLLKQLEKGGKIRNHRSSIEILEAL